MKFKHLTYILYICTILDIINIFNNFTYKQEYSALINDTRVFILIIYWCFVSTKFNEEEKLF